MASPFSKNLVPLAGFTVALMSIVPVIVKTVSANPATIGIARLAIALVGSTLLLFFSKNRGTFRLRDLKAYGLLGSIFAIHWYTYFISIKEATPVLAAIGVSTFGVHILFLNRFFFKESIKRTDLLAVSFALAGVVVASPQVSLAPEHFKGFLIGILSGLLYAFHTVANRKVNQLMTNQKAVGQFSFALLFFMLLGFQGDVNFSTDDLWGLLILGVVCTFVAHTLWIKVTAELPGNIIAVVYYFYVPLTMLWSYLYVGEVIGVKRLFGAGMIITANIVIAFTHKKKTTAGILEQG